MQGYLSKVNLEFT